jgi:methylenetetrahydrofolate dehydrogenase (NADP+)/methenyltetrahydrofolate cyclohydrolase
MWRVATLRERKPLSALVKTIVGRRYQHNVTLQLDYYMSPQFAGVACAVVNNTYEKNGLNLSFLPTCPVGLEQGSVRQNQNENPAGITLGSVEQNIFIPTLVADPSLKTTAVAAMFRRSPLCVASLRDLKKGDTIGAHQDTVSLLQRIFPDQHVITSPRATKNSDLMSDKLGGIQAYTTTEVPALRRHMGKEPHVTYLEGLNGTKLGYSQVLFAADECLEGDARDVVSSFLEATFQGWEMAIRDPKAAVEMVAEAKKILALDDEMNDHWYPSSEFEMEMVQLCNDHVKETFQGDRHGIINPARWSEASQWLMDDKLVGQGFGLDTSIWSPSKQLLPGNELARAMLEDAKASAHAFFETHGRKPSLAVVTVGELARYTHADRRIQLYSTSVNSWFAKTKTGEANGFDVQEINLDASTTTDKLLSQIYALKNVDGIQLMWPLPDHIDAAKIFNAIPASKDADGIHYVGQLEIGNKKAYPPVTPLGTIALMKEHRVDVKDKRVLVIGRSPITGSPISHMLRAEGAIVTVAHSGVSTAHLETLVRESEVVVSCAGKPGLIKAEWLDGTEVVNVGTTFLEATDSLHSDVAGPIEDYATRYSPVPGGVGPLSAPALFQNVAQAAWDQMNGGGQVENSWERDPALLTKNFHFDSYTLALDFAKKVNDMSTIMDHHANIKFAHHCVDGVDVEMQFFTFEANTLTEKDYDAAKVVDMIYGGNQIRMKDYTYNLSEDSIAKYPASPRGSSKLLKVDGNGHVSHYENFSQVFGSLAKGAHVVFNESRVLDARLFAVAPNGDRVEVMILDLGAIAVNSPCNEITLRVMIRSDSVKEGDILVDAADGASNFEVVGVQG